MRLLLLLCCICLWGWPAFAQKGWDHAIREGASWSRDTQEIRRWQRISYRHITKPGEYKADLDSAQELVNKSAALSKSINFREGMDKALDLQVRIDYERHDMAAVERTLNKMPPALLVDNLKELVIVYLVMPSSGALDTMHTYALRWQKIAQENNLPAMANDAEYYLSVYAHRKGDIRAEKRHYLNMIAYHKLHSTASDVVTTWFALVAADIGADNSYPVKMDAIREGVEAGRQSGSAELLVWALAEAGHQYFVMGKIGLAEETLLEAEATARSGHVKKRFTIYERLSRIYLVKANGSKALYYAQAALDNAREEENTPYNIAMFQNRLAAVYFTFGRMDKYRTVVKGMKGDGAPGEFTDYFYIFCHARLLDYERGPAAALDYLQERIGKVPLRSYQQVMEFDLLQGSFLEELEDYETALRGYRRAEDVLMISHINLDPITYDLFAAQAALHFKLKHYDTAQHYLNKLDAIPHGMMPLYRQIGLYNLQYKIDSVNGDYLAALRHFNLYKSFNDSLFNIEKLGQLEELDLKYETAKKDQDLLQRAKDISWLRQEAGLQKDLLDQSNLNTLHEAQMKGQALEEARQRGEALKYRDENYKLLEKKSELQQAVIQQALTTRKFVILGGVLLLLLLLVIYNRYRLKRRSNQQLQQQQEEITSKNESLQKLVDEKEWLLKEVHHRVKNNLQVVMSLLNTQSHYLQDETAISAIRDSQRRINAISLIHKKLYQADNPATVDMQLYIKELLDYLKEYASNEHQIVFNMNISPLALDISKAIPIGLILNEAITNAFKYAFAGRQHGTITVRMQPYAADMVQLVIADDGVGIKAEDAGRHTPSLGMTLMKGLSRDIDGEFNIEQENGTVITVWFREEEKTAGETGTLF